MSETYQLEFINKSNHASNFFIYQTLPDMQVPHLSLAWISKPVKPLHSVQLEWRTDYSFTWSHMPRLTPGMLYHANELVKADPNGANEVELSYQGTPIFGKPQKGPMQGNLLIKNSTKLPRNVAIEGLAMHHSPILVVDARPGVVVQFKPKPKYWMGFGGIREGEALNPSWFTAPHETEDQRIFGKPVQLKLPADGGSIQVTLEPGGKWVQ